MTIIYDVIAKRHNGCSKPDVCLFYDEDYEKAVDFMAKYCKKNGFSIEENGERYSIADLVLRERESTGKQIKKTPYCKIFNTVTGKRLQS